MKTLLNLLRTLPRSLYLSILFYTTVSIVPTLSSYIDKHNTHPAEIEAQAQQTPANLEEMNNQNTESPHVLGTISEINVTESEPEVLGTITVIGPPLGTEPTDPNGSIVIPTIGVNSPIAFDISVADKSLYQKALEKGVAHAQGTSKPTTENSNTYLFAHSTNNEANIARYAAVFTKIKQLELGQKITIFYLGKRYDYAVVQEEIVPSFDTTVLTREHNYPALTLQTCDPPGVPENRFITTARLVDVYTR